MVLNVCKSLYYESLKCIQGVNTNTSTLSENSMKINLMIVDNVF